MRDALEASQTGGSPEAVIVAAITNYAANMVTLASLGATDFLVINAPNLGVAPAVTELGPEASAGAAQLSFLFNLGLYGALDSIQSAFPQVNISRMDSFTLISAIVASPGDFGLVNGEDACVTPYVTAGAICKSPEDYVFWDGVHPTRAVHELLADVALSSLPE